MALFLAFVLRPRGGPRDPFSLPFGDALAFVALSEAMVAFMVTTQATTAVALSRPIVDIGFVAPVERASFLQARVRRALVTLVLATPVFGLLGGAMVARFLTIPVPLFLLRFFLTFLPIAGFFACTAVLLAHAFSRAGAVVMAAALVAALVFVFATLPAVIYLVGHLAIPSTKLLLGYPLDLPDLLVLALGWAAFAGTAVLASTWRYDPSAELSTVRTPAQEPLARERAPTSRAWQDLRLRLRIRYVDRGVGGAALLGRNLTTTLRGPSFAVNIMFGVLFLGILGPIVLSMGSTQLRLQMSLMITGELALFTPAMIGAFGGEGPQSDLVRLLPLRPLEVVWAFLAPGVAVGAAWAVLTGGLAAGIGAGPEAAVLEFAFVLSTGAVGAACGVIPGAVPVRTVSTVATDQVYRGPSPIGMFVALGIGLVELVAIVVPRQIPYALLGIAALANLGLAALLVLASAALYARPPRR